MKKILGLDISSSVIGWSLMEADNNDLLLLEYGSVKPPKSSSGSLAYRASEAGDSISNIISEKKPEIVVIESYANKFPAGRSTARTIIVLSVFNEVVSIAALKKMGVDPERMPVVTIRSQLSKVSPNRITSKEECFEFICKKFGNFVPKKNRKGNLAKEAYDEADAIAVAFAYFIKYIKEK